MARSVSVSPLALNSNCSAPAAWNNGIRSGASSIWSSENKPPALFRSVRRPHRRRPATRAADVPARDVQSGLGVAVESLVHRPIHGEEADRIDADQSGTEKIERGPHTAGKRRKVGPKGQASPQPLTPSSVSTRTMVLSSVRHTRPRTCGSNQLM